MAFFQNKNTQTIPFTPPVLLPNGFDYFDIESALDTTWSSFLTSTKHVARKEALEEFIVIIYYLKNRQIGVNNFPHPDIYDKFFKYLISNDGSASDPIPIDSSNSPLFTKTAGLHNFNFSSSSVKHINFLSENNIKCNLRQAIINGNTTQSAIAEGCTLFAFYYLIRTLALINGYTKNYLATITGTGNIYDLFYHSTTYGPDMGVPITVDRLFGLGVVTNVNKTSTTQSYFYLSLLDKLFTSGFINSPGTVSGSTMGSLDTNHQKYYSLLTLLFDPFISTGNFDYKLDYRPLLIDLLKNPTNPPDAMPDLTTIGSLRSMSGHLYALIYQGNFSATPAIFPNKYFNITFPSGAIATTKVDLIRGQVDNIMRMLNQNVIEPAILNESNLLYKCIQDTSLPTSLPQTKFLGSGAGTHTVGFLGIQNLGITFFSYYLKDGKANCETTNDNNTILVNRNVETVLNLRVFGIDHPDAGTNEFSRVILESNDERYYFYCNRNMQNLVVNNITPNLYNFPTGNNILSISTIGNITTFSSSYNASRSGTTTPINIAQFDSSTGDLTLYGYSNSECTTYGIALNPVYKITLISEVADRDTSLINSATSGFTPVNKSHYTVIEELVLIINKTVNFSINLSLTDSFEPDKFVLNTEIFATPSEKENIINLIKLIKAGDAIFANPILEGYFVGKLAPTITSGASRVEQDTNYFPSTSATKQEIDGTNSTVTTADRNLWKKLRHSFARIYLTVDSSSSCKFFINIEIKSFVDPSISHLDTKINQSSGNITSLITNYTKWPSYPAIPGPTDYYATLQSMQKIPSYNPVLAMLRSFGVFVAICNKFDEIAGLSSVGVNAIYTSQMNTLRTNAQSIDKSLNNPLITVIKMSEYNTYKP